MHDSLPIHGAYRRRGRRQAAARTCDQVISLVARQKNVPLSMLVHRRRDKLPVARARQLAMYLSHVVLGRTLSEIGEVFGRDRTTVSYACAVIEDMRDDRRFDEEVSGLERLLEAGMAGVEAGCHG